MPFHLADDYTFQAAAGVLAKKTQNNRLSATQLIQVLANNKANIIVYD